MLAVRYSNVFITFDAVTFCCLLRPHCSDGQEKAEVYTQNHVNPCRTRAMTQYRLCMLESRAG